MEASRPLVFENRAAAGKPDDHRRPSGYCPFCDVDHLTDIIAREDDRIWLMNKYRTLRDTVQTVVVESAEHDGELSHYPREQCRAIIRFALSCWDQMIASGEYRSVLMYKNFGPLSGGSLNHPHLQVVGLVHDDGYANVVPENLDGLPVFAHGGVEVAVSTKPIMGFFEVNIAMPRAAGPQTRDAFADAIHVTTWYLLNEHHGGRATSYNLFFYHMAGKTICKALPRWVASPYFIGYKLAQVNSPERLEDDARALRRLLETGVR